MAALALVLFALYLALLQLRRTGSTGFKGVGSRSGSVERSGGVLFSCALRFGISAPVLDLVG